MKAVIIGTDLGITTCDLTVSTGGNTKVLQDAVGGLLETIRFNWLGSEFLLWCNEEGKIDRLPFNSLATMMVEMARDLVWGDMIFGNVIITSAEEDQYGWSRGLDPEEISSLQHLLHRCVDVIDMTEMTGGL